MKKIISLILSMSMALSLGAGLLSGCQETKRDFKNVILVIGDGMGENHLLNAIDYYDLEIPSFMEDQVGYINTNSLNGTTDSAAGATALATGVKVNNSELAWHDDKNLEQITTIAQKAKMKTGIVTTDVLSGATPSGFSAHSETRNFTNKIMSTQAESGVDLLVGRWTSDYTNRSDMFSDKGYDIAVSPEQLEEKKDADKLLGLLGNIDSEYMSGGELDYQLKEMASFAIDYLENDNGFFLMIEGAYIDKYSHNNDLDRALAETRSLIDTVEFLYEYVADGETALFITADHETGALARANSKEDITNLLYNSTDHSSTPVPVFVKNYVWKPENFGYAVGVTPENTMIFEACKAIIKGSK